MGFLKIATHLIILIAVCHAFALTAYADASVSFPDNNGDGSRNERLSDKDSRLMDAGKSMQATQHGRPVIAVKTNLLYDAILSPNLGVEVGLSPKFTLDVSGNVNFWTVGSRSWKHWQVQPELRYWLCQRFTGHFFGLETHVGQFNVGNINLGVNFLGTDFSRLKDHRYQGWQGGAGLTYGYAWIVSQHWNVEAELGVGWSYSNYDSYPCVKCGTKEESGKSHNYFGVTKAQLGIVYIF